MIIDNSGAGVNSKIIVTLAKQALENLKAPSIANLEDQMSYDTFQDEFCTVKISLPRRSGHSTAALQLLFEYPDSLVVVYTMKMKQNMHGLISEYTSDLEVRKRIEDSIIVGNSISAIRNVKPLKSGRRPFVIFDRAHIFREDMYDMVLNQFKSARIRVELQ